MAGGNSKIWFIRAAAKPGSTFLTDFATPNQERVSLAAGKVGLPDAKRVADTEGKSATTGVGGVAPAAKGTTGAEDAEAAECPLPVPARSLSDESYFEQKLFTPEHKALFNAQVQWVQEHEPCRNSEMSIHSFLH